jgi:hypothetical protein
MARVLKFFSDLKLNAMLAIFWLFVIPVTSKFVEQCLTSFSFDEIEYLSMVPTSILALIFAITFDLFVFSLLNGKKKYQVAGIFLIVLNCIGAYFVSSKNLNTNTSKKILENEQEFKSEIYRLESKVSRTKAEYLTTKWPNESSPELCETEKKSCGLPFTSRAKEKHIEFLANNQLLGLKKQGLNLIYRNPVSAVDPTDLYWHLGYYIIIWMLLLMTVCFKKSSSKCLSQKMSSA